MTILTTDTAPAAAPADWSPRVATDPAEPTTTTIAYVTMDTVVAGLQDRRRYYDAKQLSARIRTGLTNLYRLHHAGKLPAPVRTGQIGTGKLRWLASEVESWEAVGSPPYEEWVRIKAAK